MKHLKRVSFEKYSLNTDPLLLDRPWVLGD